MGIIKLSFQKKLVFIPFLNPLILFIWVYNWKKAGEPFSVFVKSLLLIWGISIPIIIVQIVLQNVFGTYPIVMSILAYAVMYLLPLSVGLGLISYQEKLLIP